MEEEGVLWAGQELTVSVGVGLKQLKVISRGEDGGWKRVPVSGVSESAGSIFIQFDS